ncbi:MAG: chemotaxis protein CheC [Desulfuromonadales bacterium]|nr:chemotaxis protein CheC [Desulfuromonadales bacterium]
MRIPNDAQLDALKEVVNVGVGRAAASLNELLEAHIELDVPAVLILHPEHIDLQSTSLGSEQVACVRLNFEGSFAGTAALLFPPQSAINLVSALTGSDEDALQMNAVMAGTLSEVGNIVINAVIGSIGNLLEQAFEYSLTNYLEGYIKDLLRAPDTTTEYSIMLIQTHFLVSNKQIDGNIFIFFEVGSFDALLDSIDNILGAS